MNGKVQFNYSKQFFVFMLLIFNFSSLSHPGPLLPGDQISPLLQSSTSPIQASKESCGTSGSADKTRLGIDGHHLSSGVFIGLVIPVVVGFLVLAFKQRSASHILVAGVASALLFIVTIFQGIALQFLWPNSPLLQQFSPFWLVSCTLAFLSQLAFIRFAEGGNRSNLWINRIFKILSISATMTIPLSLVIGYLYTYYLNLTLCVIFFFCYAAVWAWKKRNHSLRIQALDLANGSLLVCFSTLILNHFVPSLMPINDVHIIQAGLVLFVVSSGLPLLISFESTEPEAELPASNNGHEEELQQALTAQNFELQITLRELQERNQELEKLNTLDALSGIHNRRHFYKRLLAELRRARREQTPLALIMFDIDHFKAINDNYGHLTGDEVIRSVAHTAAELLNRSTDEAFRYGGEEFALILPNTDEDGAVVIAEKVRRAVESLSIASNSGTVHSTVSLGVAASESRQALTPAAFIDQADRALYKAKQSGRNQVILFSQED